MKNTILFSLAILALASGCGTTQLAMLDELKSDNIRMNASKLRWQLIQTNNPPIKELEQALHSEDYQQRHFAADILRSYSAYKPSDRLLEVTVEGLADDQFPLQQTPYYSACVFLFNAREGTEYLVTHGAKAKKYLLKGIHSNDLQKQFLCAYLLGVHGIKKDIELTSSILIRHLKDNDIGGDAAAACSALYRLGSDVIPYLQAALPTDDNQQARLINLIYSDLTDVPFNEKERMLGTRDARISSNYRDPAINLVLPDFYFPHGQDRLHRAIFTPSSNKND